MRKALLLIVAIVSVTSGCDKQDGDRLARVGRKVTQKVEALIPERSPFGNSIGLGKNPSVEDRVRERFKSDRHLALQAIEITADGNTIHLKGTVDREVLKRRAVDIAESTIGVDKVVDELAISP
jgi:hypothetical protein